MTAGDRPPVLSRRGVLLGGALTGTALAGVACGPQDDGAPARRHCFTAADTRRRLGGTRVFQQAPPPADDGTDPTYPYWPCTDAVTSQDLGRSRWTGGNTWAFVWANRCNAGVAWNRKPNPLPAPREHVGDLECRAVFSTHARANAATRCQVRYLLGMDETACLAPWLGVGGVAGDVVTDADFRDRPGDHCRTSTVWDEQTYRVMVDKVLLPAARLTEGDNAAHRAGVVLDYEVQDSRSPAVTEAFVHALAHDFVGTGKRLFLFTNPFNAPTQQHTGCTAANLPRILADVDHLGVFLWAGSPDGGVAASYATQLEMLGPLSAPDLEKLVPVFELGDPGTTLDDARWLHGALNADGPHPDKVMFWRHYAEQGGPCATSANRKISLVCFGEQRAS